MRRSMVMLAVPALLLTLIPAHSSMATTLAQCGYSCEIPGAVREFLPKLQAAIRADDRAQVVAMTKVPLRVNHGPKRHEMYRSAARIRANYDRIFNANVKRAILEQEPDMVLIRGDDVMIGSGEVWFKQPCLDEFCLYRGPFTIYAINLRGS